MNTVEFELSLHRAKHTVGAARISNVWFNLAGGLCRLFLDGCPDDMPVYVSQAWLKTQLAGSSHHDAYLVQDTYQKRYIMSAADFTALYEPVAA